jgi:hypothetical protein
MLGNLKHWLSDDSEMKRIVKNFLISNEKSFAKDNDTLF